MTGLRLPRGRRIRSLALVLVAGALSLAVIACDDAAGMDEDGDETATATSSPETDETAVSGADTSNGGISGSSGASGAVPGSPANGVATPAPLSSGEDSGSQPATGGGVSGNPGGSTSSPVQPRPSTTPGTGPDAPVSSDDPPAPTPTEDPGLADGSRVVAPAPIESAEVRFAESYPVQHFLHIVSGLPSGCAAFAGTEVERAGTVFTVTVTNTMPAPNQPIACTMIYGYHESNVALGSDLEPGTEYTVHINDVTMTFVAQ